MSEEVRDLLAAVLDALSVPPAVAGHRRDELELLADRAEAVRVSLSDAINLPDPPVPALTAQLRGWTAEAPATYRTVDWP